MGFREDPKLCVLETVREAVINSSIKTKHQEISPPEIDFLSDSFFLLSSDQRWAAFSVALFIFIFMTFFFTLELPPLL